MNAAKRVLTRDHVKGPKLLHPRVTAADLVKDLPPMLTCDEACAALRCSRRTLSTWIACGKLQTVRLSFRVHIPRQAIEALLATALVPAGD